MLDMSRLRDFVASHHTKVMSCTTVNKRVEYVADPLPSTSGLVQYALRNGQPANSVLNGVLPLHAAASSGNETIVRMLIEYGADVNSPR